MNITEQQVRDFIANAAADLAVETKSDRIYVGCSCTMVGDSTVSKTWAICAGDLSRDYRGETLSAALSELRASREPTALILRAAELRKQADELESRAALQRPPMPVAL